MKDVIYGFMLNSLSKICSLSSQDPLLGLVGKCCVRENYAGCSRSESRSAALATAQARQLSM